MEGQNEGMAGYLREMCSGSVAAFDAFYQRYAPFVLRIALKQLGDRMEAEDACHDIFLEVLRKGDRYDASRGSIEAWLAVMTRSRCNDRLRRRQRVVVDGAGVNESGSLAPDYTALPEEQAVLNVERAALLDALHTLPAPQRKAVAASYLGSRSQRELAELWNVPLGTVKSWVRYGVNNIRKQLEKRGWTVEEEGGETS